MGREPVRVDILTNASALSFDDCYARREIVEWDGVKVPLMSSDDLRKNKKASDVPKISPTWKTFPQSPPNRRSDDGASRDLPAGRIHVPFRANSAR